ncbi:MAG: DUF885 domain-containing protein [Polyangiaceae bacterium]
MRIRRQWIALTLSVTGALAALLPSACSLRPVAPSAPCGPSEAEIVLDEYLERQPAYARTLGMREFDGQLADYSAAGIAERVAFLKRSRDYLEGIDPRRLSADDQLDRKLMLLELEQQLFRIEDMDEWHKRPMFYEELFSIDGYLTRDYAPLDIRARGLLKHVEGALKQVHNVTDNLVGPMATPILLTAIGIYRGYAEYLDGDAITILDGMNDRKLHDDVVVAIHELAKQARQIADHLEQIELPRGDDSFILGVERYKKLLHAQEALDIPLDEFERLGEENLAENKKAYEALAAKVTMKRPAASELLQTATDLTKRAKAFIEEKHLVTIPGEDKVQVRETPPFMRYNAAFLDPPGPFDKPELPGFYYITPPNPAWSAKEQEEYLMFTGTLLATSIHEVYPGHYLQGMWIGKAPTKVQKSLGSYSFIEGWAHYGEQLMIEEGFGAENEENHLGQLGDALLRNCRVVVSLGVHTKEMSLEAAAKRFVDDCKQDPATAREQATRATFDPGYFAYTLGKVQILKLRAEVKDKLGAKFDLQKFHDALLSHGSPPVPIVRERVLADLGIQ